MNKNKKLIIGGIAILSMTAIIVGQTNASGNILKKSNSKIEEMNKGLHIGSGFHTGLHLGSGMKPEGRSGLKLGSGNKPGFDEKGHGPKFGSGNIFTGKKSELGSGGKSEFKREIHKYGSGDNNTGKVDNITSKISKFSSTFENMEDGKLKEILTRVETMISNTTKSATLNFLNAMKSLIEGNIGD